MHILVVTAHPNTHSLTNFMGNVVCEHFESLGHEVKLFDLYAMKFDPVFYYGSANFEEPSVIEKHSQHIQATLWADGLVFIYPIWWWDRPAILKGWFDSCFTWGHAIEITNHGHLGLLKGKRSLVFQTCGDSESSTKRMNAQEVFHGCIDDGTLKLVGIHVDAVETFYSVSNMNDERLQELKNRVVQICNLWKA